MGNYKNIIFDLGGVLIDIDYYAPAREFEKLGFRDFEAMYSQTGANPLFEHLETGKIEEDVFYNELRKLNPATLANIQMQAAWNSILGNWRKESLAFLESIKSDKNIYLLSNTNQIHYNAFQQSLQKETGKQLLDDYFIKAYYSHKIHLRKPEAEIYEFVLQDAGLIKEETLFIDDSRVNIEAAKKINLPAYLLKGSEQIENLSLITNN